MAYRGYFAIDGVEFANSSRTIAHLGQDIPADDAGMFDTLQTRLRETPSGSGLYDPQSASDPAGLYPTDDLAGSNGLYDVGACGLVPVPDHPGMFQMPASSTQITPGLWTPPDGARRVGPGLLQIGEACWGPVRGCDCLDLLGYDDSWPGLREFLGHSVYRPELAPWFSTELPESGEFAGVWVMDVKGLNSTPGGRTLTQMSGSGAVAGPQRDAGRTVTFDALLIACTHAGLEFGLQWLNTQLRATADAPDAALQYLAASPAHSAVDPESLRREVRGAVVTQALTVTEEFAAGGRRHQQATVYRVSWEMGTQSPYAYLPAVETAVDWDEIVRQPVNWVHAADCVKPESCQDMPILFSTECVPEEIAVVNTPPPVCGGCLPVGGIDKYSFRLPTMAYAFRGRETALSLRIRNTGARTLTLQAFLRVCGSDIRCEDNRWPLQVSGLPPAAELVLSGISGRFHVNLGGRRYRPVGIVGTPTGAPWRPPVIDRQTCWDFIVQTATDADFEVYVSLSDRDQ